jgi:hypothetical protein
VNSTLASGAGGVAAALLAYLRSGYHKWDTMMLCNGALCGLVGGQRSPPRACVLVLWQGVPPALTRPCGAWAQEAPACAQTSSWGPPTSLAPKRGAGWWGMGGSKSMAGALAGVWCGPVMQRSAATMQWRGPCALLPRRQP